MTEKLLVEKRGNIALLTMNNPPANTWTEESLKGLKALVEELNADRDIYSLVITGQVPPASCRRTRWTGRSRL